MLKFELSFDLPWGETFPSYRFCLIDPRVLSGAFKTTLRNPAWTSRLFSANILLFSPCQACSPVMGPGVDSEAGGGVRKRKYVVLFLAFLLVMAFFTIFGENGLIHVFKLKQELKKLTEMNRSLGLENATLEEEIKFLKNHDGYLEREAHKLGLVREGEIIFQFREDR
jgi:cell division protein FtsB